jgi:hypothetical protein
MYLPQGVWASLVCYGGRVLAMAMVNMKELELRNPIFTVLWSNIT